MAEKRMFAKMIIDSDVFLDMPQSAQNLYFHLNMRADDEGFINAPKKIMRIIGSNQNDIEILLAKRYLLSFESGVIVVKHWKMHNAIRSDRMKPTMYVEEKSQLTVKGNGAYSDHKSALVDRSPQDVAESPHSLDKISIDKNRIEKYNPVIDIPFFNDLEFQEAWNDWIKVRNKKKAVKSERALKAAILKLKKYSNGNKKIAIAILDKSSQSGWTDLYELKEEDRKTLKIPSTPKKSTNTDRYNRQKLKEQNPEEYTDFNPGNLMAKIKKVNK